MVQVMSLTFFSCRQLFSIDSLPFKEGKMSKFMLNKLFAAMVFLTFLFIFFSTTTTAKAVTATAPPTLSAVPGDTTTVNLTHIDIPPIKGKQLDADLLDIDQENHRIYLADRGTNGVDVFDISTPVAKYLLTIDLGGGSNGVIVAQNVKKLFAGVNDSTVAIIDIDPASPKLNTVIARLNTGGKKRADEGDYDPKHKKLYMANSDDGFVTVIDAVTNKIIKKIDNLGEALEQPRYNPGDGMIYLTASDQNAVIVIDTVKDEVVKKFDIGVSCLPHGMAFDKNGKKALLGCSDRKNPKTVSWDPNTGKVVDVFTQVGAGDGVIYDGKIDRFFFASHRFNRGPHLGIFGGSPIKFITNVPTVDSSKSVVYDETNKLVYVTDGSPNNAGLLCFPLY
jgi:YVTN family beta-propeller protein